MALSTVLLLATGMGVNLGLQDPAFDMQFAIPVLDQNAAPTTVYQSQIPVVQGQEPEKTSSTSLSQVYEVVATQSAQGGPKVSVNFSKAPVSDVLNWLKDKGVNFVVADGMIPAGTTVTLNVVDQPVESVVEAVAAAIGGHWQRQGGMRVYRQGHAPFAFAQGADVRGFYTPGVPAKAMDVKELEKQFGPDFQKRIEVITKDAAKMSADHAKEMEKRFGPEFQAKMKKLGEQHELEMRKQFGPEFEAKMKKMAEQHEKEMQKRFGPEFQAKMKKMGEEMEVRARLMEKDHKVLLEKARKDGHTYEVRDGVVYQLKDGKAVKVQGREGAAGAPRIRTENGRTIVTPRAPVRVTRPHQARDVEVFVRSEKGGRFQVDAEKFIKSLSADQKHQMRTRGFLYYIDLTKEQKAMLGSKPDGRFELKFNVNGESVVVKGS